MRDTHRNGDGQDGGRVESDHDDEEEKLAERGVTRMGADG